METVYLVSRFLHIAAGFVALFVAPGAMIAHKGGLWHRRWGKIYFWMMALVALTAVIMAVYNFNLFLLLLAVFSFYMAFAGYRVLYMKRPHRGDTATALDWGVSGFTVATSLGLMVYGGYLMFGGGPSGLFGGSSFGVVAVVFGALGAVIAGSDIKRYVTPPEDKRAWWYLHMSGFLGAYIATMSAFSAVNFTFLPTTLQWLWPTLIGVPGIALWQMYYRRKFEGSGRKARTTQEAT